HTLVHSTSHLNAVTPFLLHHTPPTEIYTLSLHDALPISGRNPVESRPRFAGSAPMSSANPVAAAAARRRTFAIISHPDAGKTTRSEEHTSELQSQSNLVCRLLLEKKKKSAHRSPLSTLCI